MLFITIPAYAGTLQETGTSAAVMLSQPASSRLLAMGNAGVAASRGQEGLWWNPAALARYPYFNAEISFRQHWTDTEVGFFGAAIPTAGGTVGLGFIYSQTTNIEGYDRDGNSLELFSTKDMDLKIGYAYQWRKLAFGLNLEYLYQDLYIAQIHGLGGDLGLVWEFHPGLNVGVTVLHAGETTAGDPLGMEVRTGFCAQAVENLVLTFDIVLPRDDESYLAGGVEYQPIPYFLLRAGWRNGPGTLANLGKFAGLTAGAGFAWQDFYLDYVFEPSGFLGNVHHVSLGYRFTEKPATPTPVPTPFVPSAPRLKIQTREQVGKMVFIPKTSQRNFKIKGFTFKVKDKQGNVVRTFKYIGKAVPKRMVWDGTDKYGKKVAQGQFSYSFEYMTEKGVKIENQVWPVQKPVRQLFFKKLGYGVCAGAVFRFEEYLDQIKTWGIRIRDAKTGKTVRVLRGEKTLPGKVVWDGKDSKGRWVSPKRNYVYEIRFVSKTGGKAMVKNDIIAIPAKMLAPREGHVRFRILKILFDFNDTEITTEMEDKIAKAVEIYQQQGEKIKVTIQGHADEVGSEWANHNISRKRAQEVKAHMRRMGIVNWELKTTGFGKERLLIKSKREHLRSKNRRVEIQMEILKEK